MVRLSTVQCLYGALYMVRLSTVQCLYGALYMVRLSTVQFLYMVLCRGPGFCCCTEVAFIEGLLCTHCTLVIWLWYKGGLY